MTRHGFAPFVWLAVSVAALLTVVASHARAESWAVQVMALRDYRDANALAVDLERLGFDAYTEFAMNDGRQFVRVRFGCFADRTVAEVFASVAHGLGTTDAVVVRIDDGSQPPSCLRRDVGFRVPAVFRQPVEGSATFEVEVAGTPAVIRFFGDRWHVMQRAAADARPPATAGTGPFAGAVVSGIPVVLDLRDDPPRFLCPGTLLAALDTVAIVDDAGLVVACARSGHGRPDGRP